MNEKSFFKGDKESQKNNRNGDGSKTSSFSGNGENRKIMNNFKENGKDKENGEYQKETNDKKNEGLKQIILNLKWGIREINKSMEGDDTVDFDFIKKFYDGFKKNKERLLELLPSVDLKDELINEEEITLLKEQVEMTIKNFLEYEKKIKKNKDKN